MRLTWPTILTLLRIVLIPVIVGLFYVPGDLARWLCLAIFIIAASAADSRGTGGAARKSSADATSFPRTSLWQSTQLIVART